MKTIKVEIPLDGSAPVVSVDGACGSECADLTRDVEKALGKVESTERTPDWNKAKATNKNEVRR